MRGVVARALAGPLALAAALAAAHALSGAAHAQQVLARDPSRTKPTGTNQPPGTVLYTGATIGVAAHAGPTLLNDDSLSGRAGFVVGVAGRMTGLLQLSDAELGYHLSRTSPTGRAGEVGVMRHGFSLTIGLHPLFLLGLGNRWIHYVLNSVHGDIGGSYHLTTLTFDGLSKTRGDLGWQWGGGFDVPLHDPNRGSSWWLGFRYRQMRVNTDLAPDRMVNVGQHQVLVSVEHRWNWK